MQFIPSRPWRRVALAGTITVAVGGAIVALTGIGDAATMTGQVRASDSAAAISGSYVVVLKDRSVSASAVDSTASDMATRYGGKVRRTWGVALRGFEFTGGSLAARRLAADPAVAYVEQNQVYRADDTQDGATFGLDRIDQRDLPVDGSYTFSTTASNVHAYVIDTGIRLTHDDFGGRASSGADFVDNDNDATDCNGHGTHVSGTIGGTTFGVAKEVRLVAVRVLDCDGSGSTAGVIAGVNFVTQNAIQPAVANMSLGGGASAALDDAVQNSIDSGVTYAIAAGNDGADACGSSPARVPNALTVGATGQDDTRAAFSNLGSCVDIFAPGVNITSDFLDSDTATAVLSGTSMATPHVAGGAALFLATHPTASPAEVASALTDAATSGVVGDPGRGSPDSLLFVS